MSDHRNPERGPMLHMGTTGKRMNEKKYFKTYL
jgi:hypothetical protein